MNKGTKKKTLTLKKTSKALKKVQAKVLPTTVKKKQKKPVIDKLPLEEAITEIRKYWPELFPDGKLMAMEVGIKKKLKADCKERALPITFERVEACLSSISSSLAYHELIVRGGERYNKDGQAVAVVSKESVAYSKGKIEKIKMKLKKLENS